MIWSPRVLRRRSLFPVSSGGWIRMLHSRIRVEIQLPSPAERKKSKKYCVCRWTRNIPPFPLRGVVLCRVVSCRVVLSRVVSCRVVSCRVELSPGGGGAGLSLLGSAFMVSCAQATFDARTFFTPLRILLPFLYALRSLGRASSPLTWC